jgi:CDP-glycerol glycerophosphotransferase (TagB/SpsB family)
VILYFPTWRDKDIASVISLEQQIKKITENPRLNEWLDTNQIVFVVCSHINSRDKRGTVIGSVAQSPSIQMRGPGDLTGLLPRCSLFISDYSGAIPDALYLDKQVIFFPFDLEEYLRVCTLYDDYHAFAFGPIVSSVEELVSLIVSGAWRDLEPYESVRRQKYAEFFPSDVGSFSRRSFDAICLLLKGMPGESIR